MNGMVTLERIEHLLAKISTSEHSGFKFGLLLYAAGKEYLVCGERFLAKQSFGEAYKVLGFLDSSKKEVKAALAKITFELALISSAMQNAGELRVYAAKSILLAEEILAENKLDSLALEIILELNEVSQTPGTENRVSLLKNILPLKAEVSIDLNRDLIILLVKGWFTLAKVSLEALDYDSCRLMASNAASFLEPLPDQGEDVKLLSSDLFLLMAKCDAKVGVEETTVLEMFNNSIKLRGELFLVDSLSFLTSLVDGITELAAFYNSRGRNGIAERLLIGVIELARNTNYTEISWEQNLLNDVYQQLGEIYLETGLFDLADLAFSKVNQGQGSHERDGREKVFLAILKHARESKALGNVLEAIRYYERSEQIIEQRKDSISGYRNNKRVLEYKFSILIAIGELYQDIDKKKALSYLERVIGELQDSFKLNWEGADIFSRATIMAGQLMEDELDFDKCAVFYRNAITSFKRGRSSGTGAQGMHLITFYFKLAGVNIARDKHNVALRNMASAQLSISRNTDQNQKYYELSLTDICNRYRWSLRDTKQKIKAIIDDMSRTGIQV